MLYENPEMEILRFETIDVICASDDDPTNGFNGSSSATGEW